MVKKIGIGLVVVLVALLAFIATRPDTFRVERSATIAAPTEVLVAQVSDFHTWAAWSPWEKLDPGMKKTFEGAPGAAGSTYQWVGNNQVGEGKMTLAAVKPGEEVDISLEFIKPFEAKNDCTFAFKPLGEKTQVTWAMSGHNNFMGKAMSAFVNMDQMIGKDFENGLAGLKTVAEAEAVKRAEAAKAAALTAAAAAAAAATAAKP